MKAQWKLVPAEPASDQMISARYAVPSLDDATIRLLYGNMLSDAPTPTMPELPEPEAWMCDALYSADQLHTYAQQFAAAQNAQLLARVAELEARNAKLEGRSAVLELYQGDRMADVELREALELAALAAGHKFHGFCFDSKNVMRAYVVTGQDDPNDWKRWAPHLDDGDSRRLQVALGIDLIYGKFPSNEWTATKRSNDGKVRISSVSGDPKVAVLQVAAEIGRRMRAK